MFGLYRCLPAALLVTVGAATAHSAEKSQFICKSGDLVRRVIVEVGDLSTGLPCEVVYWKDKEAPGVRRVLWNARSDAAFCDSQAAGLVDKLATSGWNCDRNGEAIEANAAPAAPAQPVAPAAPVTAVPAVDAATAPATSAPAPELGALQQQTTAALTTTAQQPAPAVPALTPAPSASTTAEPDLQTAAIAPGTASSTAAAIEQLQTVIQTNLASLNQSVDGDFQAQIGDFGDLNNDGIDDAVVFFNYESSTADFTQFVAAYLFNGESYHLAATKPVGGTDLAVRKVEVETIVDGSIQLLLVLNDASQSENRRAAMVLKDGQLVEIQ